MDYPLELDVYDFCSDDLRKKLDAPRQVSFLSLNMKKILWLFVRRNMFAYMCGFIPLDPKKRGRQKAWSESE